MDVTAAANEEAIEAWNGVLFDRFVEYRDVLTAGLGAHGEKALRMHLPARGDRVLDLGCGFGDTTRRLAELVGSEGEVVGIDAAERFVQLAACEAHEVGAHNVSFRSADVQVADLGAGFDYVFSRFGTMFFASPVAALRNVRAAIRPGARLCMVVWRRKLDNAWMHRAEQVVEPFVVEDPDSEEPTCGPGPFSMADADTTSDILIAAGFEQITLRRCDLPYRVGANLDAAIALAMAIGPAGEAIRLAGDQAEQVRPQIEEALREALAEWETAEGVIAPASTWIVGAQAPAAP